MTCVIVVTMVDGVGGLWAPPHFHWNPPIFLSNSTGGIGLGITPNRFCIGHHRVHGLARARIREGAHNRKQVLSTLFAGGYECPYEDRECECRRPGRKFSLPAEEF